jgi:hypothetical protein
VSKRTKFLLGIGVIAALVIGWQVAALAVHDTGKFELDGNADNNAAAGDDWANVFAGNTTGSAATSFESEPAPDELQASIFTGGGSKDPIDISSWKWKDDAGGLPDKDNLLDSFAARYNGTSDGDVLFFGSDRYDNSGDATQGFWFFQNKITQVGTGSGTFSGVHKNGDLLVVTDFSNGGDKSTIEVFKWDNTCLKGVNSPSAGQCADANLRLLAESGSANCLNPFLGNSPTGNPPGSGTNPGTSDQFCGIVNPPETPLTNAPWPFLDKSGNSDYLNGEFFEGGISLTALGLQNLCFSSVASETRASTSTTAVLKDFVLGQLQQCQATMTTQASNSTATVLPGTSITDTATISVGVGVTAPDPTGNVTFFLCGPSATGACSSGGNQVGQPVQLNGGANTNDGTATATSAAVAPTAAGTYCFRASWPGDTNYPRAANDPLTHTNTSTSGTGHECFTVQDTFSIGTTQSYIPQDKATITMTGGSAVAGSVQFRLYASEQQCKDNGGTTATGLLYEETVNNVSGASPQSVSTTNDGVPATGTPSDGDAGYSVTATDADLFWRVTFTPTDTGITGTNSVCVEDSSVTIDNTTPPQTP